MTTPDPMTPPPVTPPAPEPPPVTESAPPPHDAQPLYSSARPEPAGFVQPGMVAGVILVVIGGLFLLGRVVDITIGPHSWPLWIIVPGLAMLVGSLVIPPRGGVGLAIPGAIVTMVGLVLWVQETYDLYQTWAYAWALVAPTGVGLGMLLYGLVHGDRELIGDGTRTTLVGLGLFLGFAVFFEGVIGLSGERVAGLDEVLPYAVIVLGAVMVVLSLFRGRAQPRF